MSRSLKIKLPLIESILNMPLRVIYQKENKWHIFGKYIDNEIAALYSLSIPIILIYVRNGRDVHGRRDKIRSAHQNIFYVYTLPPKNVTITLIRSSHLESGTSDKEMGYKSDVGNFLWHSEKIERRNIDVIRLQLVR